MPPGVNKRFGEFQRVPPPLVPVTAQPAQHSRHHATRQVRKLPGVPQNQKTRIARNKMQPLKLLRTRPADEAVARVDTSTRRLANPPRQPKGRTTTQRSAIPGPQSDESQVHAVRSSPCPSEPAHPDAKGEPRHRSQKHSKEEYPWPRSSAQSMRLPAPKSTVPSNS